VHSVLVNVTAFESSERNAAMIRDAVKQSSAKRFIAVVHSKGAADLLVALATYPDDMRRVEALVTVAGAVGGSWLADDLQSVNDKLLKKMSLQTCLPRPARSGPNGIDSMRRENRQKFLAATNRLGRAYSISAVSEEANTSHLLKPLWRRLLPYALEQDSHILEREAIVPWGKFLGRALGDHWAVALPFYANPAVSSGVLSIVDHNQYPRAGLVEAAIRIVTTDLQSAHY
jgi:pimeloyl-ACP methyl ester carboxylesterase